LIDAATPYFALCNGQQFLNNRSLSMMTADDISRYQQDGFVVIPQFLSTEQCEALKMRAEHVVEKWVVSDQAMKLAQDQSAVFTTENNDRTNNHFFLDSAENIRCFFEEGALDSEGKFVQEPEQCINKIGHALHELDPVFEAMSHDARLGVIAHQLGMAEPVIRQSMYIFKQPRIGGEIHWHQDATFFFTTPQSVVTYWFAIEDATLENGCLWVEPKGHQGPLREVFKRTGDATDMESLDRMPWPTDVGGEPMPVKAGTLICFDGLLPHYSAPNRSSRSRQAYTLHVTDNAAAYSEHNWIQTRELPLRGFNDQ